MRKQNHRPTFTVQEDLVGKVIVCNQPFMVYRLIEPAHEVRVAHEVHLSVNELLVVTMAKPAGYNIKDGTPNRYDFRFLRALDGQVWQRDFFSGDLRALFEMVVV